MKYNFEWRGMMMVRRILLRFMWVIFVAGIYQSDEAQGIHRGRLMVPASYTAFSHDLHVQLHIEELYRKSPNDLRLQLTRIDENTGGRATAGHMDIFVDPQSNVTQIAIPCQYFTRGGIYELEIVENDINSNTDSFDERLRQQLDVRWPIPKLSVTPESIGTYPQEPLTAILEYPNNECVMPSSYSLGANVPEFWLELLYCGHNVYCDSDNITKSQLLYKEQVRGFPKTYIMKLSCDFFGLAGHYVVKLKPDHTLPSSVTSTAYVKADWSEQFVFNVHARSIFPCDTHSGISVLFEYPACILDQADRVRLFAKLRADVASLAPPTSLHYVTEQRVMRGQHSLHFDCDLFSEKYVEYCFVYVSQAITNAVADVRMDCVPTLPVSDSDTGGWGPWSDWTPCSTTCAGGTKNRYRFCDSPPPRYGAKFCEGSAVETERCGGPVYGTWDCIYGPESDTLPADRPEIKAEIGPGCRCGCIVHLGVAKPRRLIASSSKSCPGRVFWLIQADDAYRIQLNFDFFRLPCASQSLKIRDGDALSSDLIGKFMGGNDDHPESIISAGSQILIDFFSNELEAMGKSCGGGFLAHAHQIPKDHNMTFMPSSKAVMQSVAHAPPAMQLTVAHLFVILFISVIIVISLLLGAQYIFRYRKYQLAESVGEPDSPAHTPRASLASFNAAQRVEAVDSEYFHPPSRAISTTTLISEVISLVKLRPRGHRVKHSRLRESIDVDTMEKGGVGRSGGAPVATADDDEDEEEDGEVNEDDMKDGVDSKSRSSVRSDDDDDISLTSTHTLTNETLNDLDNPRKSKTGQGYNNRKQTIALKSLKSHQDVLSESDGASRTGSEYSPPSVCNSVSLPPTPSDTPVPMRKTAAKFSLASSETKSMNGRGSSRKGRIRDVSPVREEGSDHYVELDERKPRIMSACSIALSNIRASYSPASSMISTATIRTTSQKESKEKQNREKLLAGPGSEFSLANAEDFELDYYDYNVINAGAAPGSYLGMDPAYLVWIPPIDEGNIINEVDDYGDNDDNNDDEPHYEEILPRNRYIDPGSNTETPDEEVLPELPPMKQIYTKNNKNLAATILRSPPSPPTPAAARPKLEFLSGGKKFANKIRGCNSDSDGDEIQLHDFTTNRHSNRSGSSTTLGGCSTTSTTTTPITSPPGKIYNSNKKCEDVEKETAVFKSPSDNKIEYSYQLDDIQFADEDEDELEGDEDDDDDDDIEVMVVRTDKRLQSSREYKMNKSNKAPVATAKGHRNLKT